MSRPLLFNADHILNAPEEMIFAIGRRRSVTRLYDSPHPGTGFLCRLRMAWSVFRGEYDALCWTIKDKDNLEFLKQFYSDPVRAADLMIPPYSD